MNIDQWELHFLLLREHLQLRISWFCHSVGTVQHVRSFLLILVAHTSGCFRILCNTSFFIKICAWHRLEYDEFVRDFAKHLVVQFSDRVDTYVTAAMQASLKDVRCKIKELMLDCLVNRKWCLPVMLRESVDRSLRGAILKILCLCLYAQSVRHLHSISLSLTVYCRLLCLIEGNCGELRVMGLKIAGFRKPVACDTSKCRILWWLLALWNKWLKTSGYLSTSGILFS